jgi:hypothetical protein
MWGCGSTLLSSSLKQYTQHNGTLCREKALLSKSIMAALEIVPVHTLCCVVYGATDFGALWPANEICRQMLNSEKEV